MPSARHYRITLADALAAHDAALEHGGLPGVLNQSLVESAIGRPYSGYYRSVYAKAAALVHSIARNHGFADGNKRTCLLVLHLFVESSGYTLRSRSNALLNDEIEMLILDVANGHLDYDGILIWMKNHVPRRRSRR